MSTVAPPFRREIASGQAYGSNLLSDMVSGRLRNEYFDEAS
jgi:hypothetical protein